MVTTDPKLLHCPALVTIKAIAGKWKTRVLWLLRDHPHHFGELRDALPGVSAKVLTDQLRELDAAGLIAARDDLRHGVTYRLYGFTDHGRSLIPILDLLGEWGVKHDALGPKTPSPRTESPL
ncbi:MAG: helix-turn-helix domain-containing protein [bacterium]